MLKFQAREFYSITYRNNQFIASQRFVLAVYRKRYGIYQFTGEEPSSKRDSVHLFFERLKKTIETFLLTPMNYDCFGR